MPPSKEPIEGLCGLFITNEHCLYGVVTENGTSVIPPKYDDIEYIGDNVFKVQEGSCYGLINTSGTALTDIVYSYIGTMSEGIVAVAQGYKYGYITAAGKTLIPCNIYSMVSKFENGLARVNMGGYRRGRVFSGGKWGLVNNAGRVILLCNKYRYIHPEYAGKFIVRLDGENNKALYGVIDRAGRELLSCTYQKLVPNVNNTYIAKRNSKYHIIDDCGNVLTSKQYDIIYKNSEGLNLVYIGATDFDHKGKIRPIGQNRLYGFINERGTEVIECRYGNAASFQCGLAAVSLGGKWGYINRSNELVIPYTYDKYSSFEDNKATVMIGQTSYEIDVTGAVLKTWTETYHDESPDFGYSADELQDMYNAAYGYDASAVWNND